MSRSEHEFDSHEPHSVPGGMIPEAVDWVDRMLESSASSSSNLENPGSPVPIEGEAGGSGGAGGRINAPKPGTFKPRWMIFALVSLLLLTILTAAGIILIKRPSSTVDQLLILTVPSGAAISFDSQDMGRSPVKLEGVRIGTHSIEIKKDGYKTVSQPVSVTESSQPLDFKLEPIPPSDTAGLSDEDQIRQYQDDAEQAFARGSLALPYEESSALYFADLIVAKDPSNQFGIDMRDKVRRALLQTARSAMARADLAQAQEVVAVLNEHYPGDEAAKAAAKKLESEIALHKGDVRELLRKADEALQAGSLIQPRTSSALYFSRQAMTLDRSNNKAKSIVDQVRANLFAAARQSLASGDAKSAEKELLTASAFFPRDAEIAKVLADLRKQKPEVTQSPDDPREKRLEGLEHLQKGEFARAANDLQFAYDHGVRTTDVIAGLGRAYFKMGELEQAIEYLKQVPATPAREAAHVTALGTLGEIAASRGNAAEAIEYYTQAKDLGGSIVYSVPILDEKISGLERRQKAVLERPTRYSIQVTHQHGGILHGSCTGQLSVDETGVRFDGKDHHFAANLVRTGITISKNEIDIQHEGRTDKFKAPSTEAAAMFKATLDKYQAYANAQR
ncbi:MAG: PEGA domain-containing protein [Blastocatellia bacterium]